MKSTSPGCGRRLATVFVAALPLSVASPGQVAARSPGPADFPGALVSDAAALPSTDSALLLLAGIGLTLGVHGFEDAAGASRALDQGAWDSMADAGNVWGDIRIQAPLALGTWAAGGMMGDEGLARTGFDLSRSLALSYGAVTALKVAVDRERPNGARYSFPSGHTSAAFSTAGVVTRRHGGWPGAIALVVAGWTAMGRMEDLKHHPSDTVAGAALGWIIGRNAARPGPAEATAWRLEAVPGVVALVRSF